jgi:hypothetical protein
MRRRPPALPDKSAAAHALPLGVADKMFLTSTTPMIAMDTRLYGAIDRVETGSYTLRPIGQPVVEGYFGGKFARELKPKATARVRGLRDRADLRGARHASANASPAGRVRLGARSPFARCVFLRQRRRRRACANSPRRSA